MTNHQTIIQRLKGNKLISVILLILILLSLFWFFQHREPKKALVQKPLDRIPVTVSPVIKAAVRDSFSTVGTVEAFREADIFSESAGLVRKVSAEPGSHKKAGDALVIVDDELAASHQRKADAHTARPNATSNATKHSIQKVQSPFLPLRQFNSRTKRPRPNLLQPHVNSAIRKSKPHLQEPSLPVL